MYIQSRTTLTKNDVLAAARYAQSKGHDIYIDNIIVAPRGGITFYCNSLHGNRATNGRGGRAASWTAWGWLIADLYMRDPNARIGQYKNAEDFQKQCRRYVRAGQNLKFLAHPRIVIEVNEVNA